MLHSDATSRRTRFAQDGFLTIEKIATLSDIEQLRSLLDPLFARFASLPSEHALDLAPISGTPPRIPDINHAVRLEPRLRRTQVFRNARVLASQLLGHPVFCTFDHAIYKPPRTSPATPWHQDQAYAGVPRALHAVHLWIPLQEATPENGCMWFVPGSHTSGLVAHDRVEGTRATLVARLAENTAAVCCPVSVGGATVHGPLTLHMTGPNLTGASRKAWIVHFARFGALGHLNPVNLLHRLARRARGPLAADRQ